MQQLAKDVGALTSDFIGNRQRSSLSYAKMIDEPFNPDKIKGDSEARFVFASQIASRRKLPVRKESVRLFTIASNKFDTNCSPIVAVDIPKERAAAFHAQKVFEALH